MNYRSGTCRNEQEKRKSHTYVEDEGGDLYPMCGYGWNRSDGYSISIFRGPPGSEGTCKLCQKNLRDGKPPVREPWRHPTKWL